MDIPVKLLDPSVETPSYAYEGDAGLDLRAAESLSLDPLERATVSCGFAMAIPEGYAGLVVPRSGMASEHGISIVNSPGLIDSGYRGEVKVVLVNLDAQEAFRVEQGDRIAQLVLVATPSVRLVSVDELPASERGAGGFGSSGT